MAEPEVDWIGNRRTTFATLGASNHSKHERQKHDYYATDPIAIKMLEQTGFFKGVGDVWEPACGGGHLAEAMKDLGIKVRATDLYDQGYGHVGVDFLDPKNNHLVDGIDAIVTNPPYKYALEFCEMCINLRIPKFAMFLKLTFLESRKRLPFFKQHPPRYVAVCVDRIQCALNGDQEMFAKSSAACYAWFVWEKFYNDRPEILWVKKERRINE